MSASSVHKGIIVVSVCLAVWLGFRYLLPISLPFLLGAIVSFAAEPLVGFTHRHCKVSRTVASGIGVTVTLILLGTLLLIVGALLVKELGRVANAMPDLENAAQQGIQLMQDYLTRLANHAPKGVRSTLTKAVNDVFSGSSEMVGSVTRHLPGTVSAVLGGVGDGMLGVGTGILASFMISSRLPQIKTMIASHMPESWRTRLLPALKRMRKALGAWLRVQGKLLLITYAIIAVGFLLLRIPNGFLWAMLVAAVDAVPVLGTGTVLIPWALISLLQQEHLRAIGLLCVFGAAAMTRTTLEPRLMGKQLGIDPLVTLVCIYAGFRLLGIVGVLLAPVAAMAIKSIAEKEM